MPIMPNSIISCEEWLKRIAIALSSAGWLDLAAAPTFAVMALLTWFRGGDMPDMLCATVHGPSLLDGMVPMYLLMSAVHLRPWLKLIARFQTAPHLRNLTALPLSRAV